MPQERTLLHRDAGLTVERVMSHLPPAQWSATYRAPSPRWVLPFAGATEFELGADPLLVDSISLLRLPDGLPYRMKPGAGAAASIVVSTADAAPQADAWVLPARAIWLLRRHWRALARGDAPGVSTGALLQAAAHAASRMPRGGPRPAALVQRALRFMSAHVSTPVSTHGACGAVPRVQDVADAACASPFHLARTFRRCTGIGLHGYLLRLRLAAALQRLEDGERDLAALAHDTGFASQSHLGALFRRELGVTPGAARAALGW